MHEQIPTPSTLPTDKKRLARMLKALGNPVRFQIMETLAERQMCMTHEIVATTPLAQSTVSQHLKVLREARLIQGEVDGPATCYCIDPEGVQWLKSQIDRWLPECCPPIRKERIQMTVNPSQPYFERVAEEWDTLRSGYFTEAVRETAIQKAYLRPEMEVADIGAGTGFMTTGLAPLVRKVHLVDASAAMLIVAQRNLSGFSNVEFHTAEGLTLPFADASLDAVFANMYLHHCPDPLAALSEMVRVLKPGGRLMLTDMDTHPYTWLKEVMADIWLGFERDQMRDWLAQVGLVNRIVDCTGESCCADCDSEAVPEAERQVIISVFYATGTRRITGMREEVQAHYGALAQAGVSCCAPAGSPVEQAAGGRCCTPVELFSLEDIPVTGTMDWQAGYSSEQTADLPEEATGLHLGCGNPTAVAGLKVGEVVLDIGSGAGLDALLAARQVGPHGRVIGVDMTPAMLERARRAVEKAGATNVEFRQGSAEVLPVADNSVDVILSNCVINLVEDKGSVFMEAMRVLKPGGRLEISDVVFSGPPPIELRNAGESWASCIAGALPEQEYLDLVKQAGFVEAKTRRAPSNGQVGGVEAYSIYLEALKPEDAISSDHPKCC